jgi:hypothetical protein
MTASFAWIDNSVEDRRRMLDAIDRLKETDSRDELGLATIRDGFANALFPGTGTLQTRAAYFLFIPWLYRELHRKKITHERVEAAGRREEINLIKALMESDDTEGVIGKVAQQELKRLPSSIYWNGLRTWGVFERDITLDEYHRQFEFFREGADGARDDDEQLLDGAVRRDWNPGIPAAPESFPKSAFFKLRKQDRAYLTERITLAVGSSLLAWLLRHGASLDSDTPWDHPQASAFPADIRKTLHHAQCFSDVMHGAPFLYNLMLAEELPPGERRTMLIDRYRSAIQQWRDELVPRREVLSDWPLSLFWEFTRPLMRVSPGTMDFVRDWVSMKGWLAPDGLVDSQTARTLIRHRERRLKGARARLGNQRALELWGQDSGTARLLYRWPSALRLLRDLRPELTNDHAES